MKKQALICAYICISLFASAQCDLKPTFVTLFKDGTTFVERTSTCNADQGKVTVQFPQTERISFEANPFGIANQKAILGGTFFEATDNSVVSILQSPILKPSEQQDFTMLLRGQIGKTAKVVFSEIAFSSFTGTLREVNTTSEVPLLTWTDTKGAWRFAAVDKIQTITFDEETPEPKMSVQGYAYTLELDKKKGNQEIRMLQLRDGMAWTPSYRFTILPNQKVAVELWATILNDLEDLKNVQMNLVVGIPTFLFKAYEDPLFSSLNVASFLAQFHQRSSSGVGALSNVVTSQSIVYGATTDPGSTDESTGSNEDLHLFKIEGFDLLKGSKKQIRLMTQQFSFADKYSVDVAPNAVGRYYQSSDETELPTVWHSMEIKNTTNTPLTTAPVMFLNTQDDHLQPLSQYQLDYIPVGHTGLVKMNVANNIVVQQKEKEVRRDKSAKWSKDVVKIEVTIEISNYLSSQVDMELRRLLMGDLIDSSHPFETAVANGGRNNLNAVNNICWKLKIPANDVFVVTYTYDIVLQ